MTTAAVGSLARYATLFDDIGALKRTRRAGASHSVAAGLFARAWRRAIDGVDLGEVARETTALAIAASRLGAIDGAILARAGLDSAQRVAVLREAFDRAAGPLPLQQRDALRATLPDDADLASFDDVPMFVFALADQARAGATAPDAPRLVLDPPESHAEHCLAVCTYAVLAAPRYETSGEDAFVLGMVHHLHNAVLPDSGFAGELLLGAHLDAIVDRFTEGVLADLPPEFAARARDVRTRLLPSTDEPEARAFHAGDVIDRVLQVRQYARVAAFEMSHALDDLELVHAGPIQRFHLGVLAEAGLA
ncbi:MAG: hypothetical protein NVS2B8_09190 [Vulcanimicrobiaceae bacterium]